MLVLHVFRRVFQERARESPRTVGALLLVAMNSFQLALEMGFSGSLFSEIVLFRGRPLN